MAGLSRAKVFGQAMAANRPHLVHAGCVTPHISAAEYARRRERFVERMKPGSVAVLPGNSVQFASPSVFYPFRQDPTFQYLTGFLEPGSCLLLSKKTDGKSGELLLVPEKNPKVEQWEGERTGTQLAAEEFGVSDVADVSLLQKIVKQHVDAAEMVYVDLDPATTSRQGRFFDHELGHLVARKTTKDVRPLADALRVIKSEAEIDCLRVAGEISGAAYNRAYQTQFVSEHQLHAYLDFMFKQGGCESDAYLAVVAGGDHALTIHYVRNDDLLRDGDLVLVDAGGRYGGYCADISRTWPVNGTFSDPQRDLYEAVLAVNKACIGLCTESANLSLYELHAVSEKLMRSELANAGLDLSPELVRVVYPHMIGHNLGLDVHDGASSNADTLKANQVVTVEPGVYVPRDDRFPSHFQGIGIRVEDDVVVGKTISENLTEDCLKEIDDIQRV